MFLFFWKKRTPEEKFLRLLAKRDVTAEEANAIFGSEWKRYDRINKMKKKFKIKNELKIMRDCHGHFAGLKSIYYI